MTPQEFRAYVRSLLAEPQASYWTDEEIDAYTAVAITNLLGAFYHLLYPFYSKTTTLDVEAGNPYVALPDDCYKVIWLKLTDKPEEEFPYIPENLRDYYNINDDLSGWYFEAGKIKIVPTPTEDKAGYLTLRYLPEFTSLSDVPKALHPLLAVEVVIQSKVKDENVPSYLLVLKQEYYNAALRYLSKLQFQNEEVVEK